MTARSRDEAYEEFEKACRHTTKGHIGHTWTEKSAFHAGWRAALDAVRADYEAMPTFATFKEADDATE